ncbi:hypothetical protein DM01DRAFT_1337260 [Hesseltinella vesiculosa]|uniref:Uncharacterized protein n=1 Tax=Hesseltinella vesiculosa TaxID=101127 RepID=A0A1X2GDB2_9FUNG|nr:hypothetical protein DM01DRAFT_1337260 [Hesseltinella vesiculosa]
MAMLYFVSVRFKEDSAYHYRVCDYIWQLLTSPVPLERLLQREYANNQPDQRPNNATDVAWDQTRKYDVMTYRERQDMMHSNVGFNPNFRGRRQAPALAKENAAPSGRDPMSAKPYLQPVNPPSWDELKKSKDSSRMIGRPGSLMQVFWSSRDSDDLTRNFDGQKPMLEE